MQLLVTGVSGVLHFPKQAGAGAVRVLVCHGNQVIPEIRLGILRQGGEGCAAEDDPVAGQYHDVFNSRLYRIGLPQECLAQPHHTKHAGEIRIGWRIGGECRQIHASQLLNGQNLRTGQVPVKQRRP